jgi:hypothetical protein
MLKVPSREWVAIAQALKSRGDRSLLGVGGDQPMKARGDRTLAGRMSDREQSEGLWAIARLMGVGRSHRL